GPRSRSPRRGAPGARPANLEARPPEPGGQARGARLRRALVRSLPRRLRRLLERQLHLPARRDADDDAVRGRWHRARRRAGITSASSRWDDERVVALGSSPRGSTGFGIPSGGVPMFPIPKRGNDPMRPRIAALTTLLLTASALAD